MLPRYLKAFGQRQATDSAEVTLVRMENRDPFTQVDSWESCRTPPCRPWIFSGPVDTCRHSEPRMRWDKERTLNCFQCPELREEVEGAGQGARLPGSGRLRAGGQRAQALWVEANPRKKPPSVGWVHTWRELAKTPWGDGLFSVTKERPRP